MRKVIFGKQFLIPNVDHIDQYRDGYIGALTLYKKALFDIGIEHGILVKKTDNIGLSNVLMTSLTYRSTEGTQELENKKIGIREIDLAKNEISKEIRNKFKDLKSTLNIMETYLNAKIPKLITNDFIKQVHKEMFDGISEVKPGRFRNKNDQDVMILTSNKLFVSSKDVREYMDSFINHVNVRFHEHPIVNVAMFHGVMLGIHPFKDGNGRIVRLLSDKLLSKDLEVPIFLSEVMNKTRGTSMYHKALDAFHLNGETQQLINYFFEMAIEQLKLNTNLIYKLINDTNKYDVSISKKNILKYKYVKNISQLLASGNLLSSSQIENELNVTRITAKKIIDILIDNKYLKLFDTIGRVKVYKAIEI